MPRCSARASCARSSCCRASSLAAAVPQELRQLLERLQLGVAHAVAGERVDGVREQLLGLGVAPLRGAHDAERHPRRPDRQLILGADGLDRLQREPLRLVDLAARHENLREEALRLAEVPAVADVLERPHRLAQDRLRLVGAPARAEQPAEVHLRRADARDVADVGVELDQLAVAALGFVPAALDLAQPGLRPESGRTGADAAALLRELGRLAGERSPPLRRRA